MTDEELKQYEQAIDDGQMRRVGLATMLTLNLIKEIRRLRAENQRLVTALETDNKRLAELQSERDRLREQNRRLVEAIRIALGLEGNTYGVSVECVLRAAIEKE